MRRLLLLFMVVFVLVGAGTVKLASFEIERQNNDFVITWTADREEEVRGYELFRRTSFNKQYVKITQTFILPHGVNKPYLFKDDQVYKTATEEIDYRLEAVYTDGKREILREQSVNYTPTAIRRTWGSIKAMFQ